MPISGEKGLTVVPLPARLREESIAHAEGLLARCISGETVAVTSIEEKPDGTYSVEGSGTLSRLQTAGVLLDAAMRRLNS